MPLDIRVDITLQADGQIVGRRRIDRLVIARTEDLVGEDEVYNYDAVLESDPDHVVTVEHRYGDGWMPLAQKALEALCR